MLFTSIICGRHDFATYILCLTNISYMEMKLFNDTAAYVKDLTNLIWNYIRNREQYPDNAKLAVQPEILANVIDDPAQCAYCDFYDLSLFIAKDTNGQLVPNQLAIRNVANRYYTA